MIKFCNKKEFKQNHLLSMAVGLFLTITLYIAHMHLPIILINPKIKLHTCTPYIYINKNGAIYLALLKLCSARESLCPYTSSAIYVALWHQTPRLA